MINQLWQIALMPGGTYGRRCGPGCLPDPRSQTRARETPATTRHAGLLARPAINEKARLVSEARLELPGRTNFKPRCRYPRPSSAVSACRYAWYA